MHKKHFVLGTRAIALSLPSESSLSFWKKQHREIRAVNEKPSGNWGVGGAGMGRTRDRALYGNGNDNMP